MDKKISKKYLFKRGREKADCNCHHHGACGGAVYGLGFIGAAIYYISTAAGFWMGVLGVLKALVWPAFLVYALLKSLGM
ncbi:Uncharacterised protein [uncultured archaeon]|nr:Uncharacterised protein [uncultured archaeon]